MDLKIVTVSILGILGLASCTTATPTVLPDGSKGVMIDCNGDVNSMSSCFKKAGEVCPAGYDILNQGQESTPVFGGSGTATGFGMYGGAIVHRNLMVHCK
jgi:hypothetical protein